MYSMFMKLLQSLKFKCHLCRKQYDWNHDYQKIHEISNVYSMEIMEEESPFRSLLINQFPNELCKFYKIILNNQDEIHYIILCPNPIDDEIIQCIILECMISCIGENYIQRLKQDDFYLGNVDFHLDEYYDNVIIKRLRNV